MIDSYQERHHKLLPSDRTRLAQILAMLGSAHNGEQLAAAKAAHRLVVQRGLTWGDVLTPAAVSQPSNNPLNWRSIVRACQAHDNLLDAWEFDFLSSLLRFHRLSWKQKGKLTEIAERLRAAGCAL